MINKLIVKCLSIMVLTGGFSFCVLAEQNISNTISQHGIFEAETVIWKVSPDNSINSNSIPLLSPFDTLDQQQTVDSDNAFSVTGNGSFAQSFIPTLERLTQVELKIYKMGIINGVKISIRSNLTGPDLTWKFLNATQIPTNPINKSWVEFDFQDIFITPGNTYYIIWKPVGIPDCYNNTYWCFGTNNPYINGSTWIHLYNYWAHFSPVNFSNPDFCFKTYGLSKENTPPDKPATPIGNASGKVGVSYAYESSSVDIDGDQIYYLFDWDDGNTSEWLGPFNSGASEAAYHSWARKGSYNIRVKVKDTIGAESPWSDPLPITMPYSFNKPTSLFIKLLFKRFPYAFQFLQVILTN